MNSSKGLNGSHLRIVTRWDNMYKYDVDVRNFNETSFQLRGGYAVIILRELSVYLNFSYELVTEVKTFAFEKAEMHKIDLFLASYSLYESRARIVDPTFVVGSSRIFAFLNHDFEESTKSFFIEPFETLLWFTLLGFIVIICIGSSLVALSENIFIKDTIFHGVSLTIQKATNMQFQKFNSRLVMWIVCLTATCVLACYSGQMVSLLAIKVFKIRSLEALVDSNFNILLEKGYNNGSPIQTITESLKGIPVVSKLLSKASQSCFKFESFEKGIEEVQNGPSAYIIDEQTGLVAIKNVLGHFPCSWGTISVLGIHYPWSMFMRKKSPYKSAFNSGLLRLDEVGLLLRARRQLIPSNQECELEQRQGRSHSELKDGVPLHQVYPAFVIYAAGLVSSVAFLLIFENKYNSEKDISI